MSHLGHNVGPNDTVFVWALGKFCLFVFCSFQLTDCTLRSKLLVMMGTIMRWPMPNTSHTNPLLPIKMGSEAVNWGQEGAEGHQETCEGGYLWYTLTHACKPTFFTANLPTSTQEMQPSANLLRDDTASTSSPASHCLQGGLWCSWTMMTRTPQRWQNTTHPPQLWAPACKGWWC